MRHVLRYAPGVVVAFTLLSGQPPAYDEALRPVFHFAPARNWINDPNGLVYSTASTTSSTSSTRTARWQHMSWGHAVSRDLVHWEDLASRCTTSTA